MKCGTNIPDAIKAAAENRTMTREDKIAEAKLLEMQRWLTPGVEPVIRAAFGLDAEKRTGDAKHELNNWIMHKINLDINNDVLSNADINYLYAEGLRQKDVIQRTKKWGSKDEFNSFVNKVIFLPQDVFRREIVGGEDFFLRTQIVRSDRDGYRSRMATNVNTISKHIDMITRVERGIVAKAIAPLEAELGSARDELRLLKNAGGKVEPEVLKKAKLRADAAQMAYDRAMSGKHENPEVGRALRTLKTMALALDGRYVNVDEATGVSQIRQFDIDKMVIVDEVRDPNTGEPMWIYDSKINHAQLMKVLKINLGTYRDASQADGMMKEIETFLDEFAGLARKGFKAERKNMIHTLVRGSDRMDREEATRLVDKAMNLKFEDIYFPRQSIEALARIERMAAEVQSSTTKRSMLELATRDPKMFAFPGEETPQLMERDYNNGMPDISYDIPAVLHRYGNRMIDYWHNNQLHLESNRFLERLWGASRVIKNDAERQQFEMYVDGVTKYIADFVDRSKNTTQGGKMNEVFKIMTAWKASLTMGFLNPSSPVVNLAEGQALIFTRAGRHYFFDADKKNMWQDIVKELGIGLQHTDITEETYMGLGDVNIFDTKYAGSLSNADRKRYGMEQLDTNKTWLTRLADASTDFAKKSIILQRKAENINRGRSFRAGALMEYEFLDGYKNLFIGGTDSKDEQTRARNMVTDAEMEMLGITDADLATEVSRQKAWKRIARERVVKAGFEMVYQTQWNYNQVARHYFEREPIGRLALMYQHYPLSWLSSWRRTFEVLNGLRRAGGGEGLMDRGGMRASLKAMYEPTSKDIAIGAMPKGLPQLNSEAMYALIAGSIATSLLAIRYGTGVVLGQMFQHPLSESVEDMVKYVHYGFTGEHEAKKTLFWGRGLVNQFTGPMYTDLMDTISLASVKVGIDDGDMPRFAADILRGTVGFRPNDMLLTEYGRRKFSNAWDVMNEAFLFGSMSVAPKAVRLSQSVPVASEWIWNNSLMQAMPGVDGPIKKSSLQDLAYQSFRAVGVRDQKKSEANLKRVAEQSEVQ